MKSRRLIFSLVVGLILALALTWALGNWFNLAEAARGPEPHTGPSTSSPDSADDRRSRPLQASGSVITVCLPPATCPYTSVQAAVDAATDGDVIKVAAGTYTDVHHVSGMTQVVYISKTVTIQGGYTTAFAEPPDPVANPTILDAQGRGRVVVIKTPYQSPPPSASVARFGQPPGPQRARGPIHVSALAQTQIITPVIEGFHITGGDATAAEGFYQEFYAGGGIYVIDAAPELRNNWIYGNTAGQSGWGGGVYVGTWSSIPEGGPVSTLKANRIYGNTAHEGTGLAIDWSAATLISNAIIDNHALEQDPSPQSSGPIEYHIIEQEASSTHSGILIAGSTCRAWHTTIANNTAGEAATGVSVWSGYDTSVHMTNTIVSNHAYAGVFVRGETTPTLNGVLWHQNGVKTDTVWGGAVSVTLPYSYTGNPAFAGDGYHLTSGSAAIDKGVPTVINEDIDGEVRPMGNGPDLGADEYAVGTIAIRKVTDPPGGAGFSFTGDLGTFDLDDGDEQVFSPISIGTYHVTEQSHATFDLAGLTCVEDVADNSNVDVGAGQAVIELDPDETVTCTFANTVSAPPTGDATNSDGITKDTYEPDETVYVTGSGFVPSTLVHVYVVSDDTWLDGMAIPPDLSGDGMNAISTDPSGGLGPTAIWSPPLVAGEYDVVFDANRNGQYDAATDAVHDPNHPGFVVEFIEILVDPQNGGTIVYTESPTTTIQIPAGAVDQPVKLCFSPLISPTYKLPDGVTYANRAFQFGNCAQQPAPPIPVGGVTFPPLVSLRGRSLPLFPYLPIIMRDDDGGSRTPGNVDLGRRNSGPGVLAAPNLRAVAPAGDQEALSSTEFDQPVTITIEYTDEDIEGINEEDLRLFIWTGTEWQDAATTCSPASTYVRNLDDNILQVEICHLSQFAFGG